MNGLVVNKHIDGFKEAEIEEVNAKELGDTKNVIIVLNEKSNGKVDEYFRKIRELSVTDKRVILITVKGKSNIEQACTNVMLLFKNYDIYEVESTDIIDGEYIKAILGRHPSYTETQSFLGNNRTSYGNVTELLANISRLIEENNQPGLENYVAENFNAIRDIPEVVAELMAKESAYNSKDWLDDFEKLNNEIEKIKSELSKKDDELGSKANELLALRDELSDKNTKLADMSKNLQVMEVEIKAKQAELDGLAVSDSKAVDKMNEVIIEMNELKEKHQRSLEELESDKGRIADLENQVKMKEQEIGELEKRVDGAKSNNSSNTVLEEALNESKKVIDNLKNTVDTLNTEIGELKKENIKNNDSHNSDNGIIKTYSELHTSLVNCKVDNILYFKEISYVNYMNSLIKAILGMCNAAKIKVKLLIYDNCGVMSSTYSPLNIVNSQEFFRNKERIVKNVEAFVVTEPNQAIIESVVTCSDPKNEILIVYDRMKQLNNIIAGNNVTNYWVANSSNDVKNLEQRLKINDKSRLIVGSSYHEKDQSLKIPTIPDYENKQGASTIAAYSKLTYNGVPIIQTILGKANIDLKHKRR